MSFVEEEDVFSLVEGMMTHLFGRCLDAKIEGPFPRIDYEEAMEKYGTDKPDLRFGLHLVDLSEAVRGCDYRVFRETLEGGGCVKSLVIPGEDLETRAREAESRETVRAKGLARTRVAQGRLDSSFAKFLDDLYRPPSKRQRAGDQCGGCRPRDIASRSSALRSRIEAQQRSKGRQKLSLGLPPAFERDADRGPVAATTCLIPLERTYRTWRPSLRVHAAVRSVLNGFKLASGSVRIHRRDYGT
jgi:aspartyl-tRNA synthetase